MRHALPRGVTLIELVIVLAVLAVLGSLAVPGLNGRVARERLHHAAESLAADLAEARFEAARSGRTLHLSATPGRDWCWSVSAMPACPCGQANRCQIKTVHAAEHPGVELLAAAAVSMAADGEVAGRLGAQLASAQGDRLRVELQPLGRARVCTQQGVATRHPAC